MAGFVRQQSLEGSPGQRDRHGQSVWFGNEAVPWDLSVGHVFGKAVAGDRWKGVD